MQNLSKYLEQTPWTFMSKLFALAILGIWKNCCYVRHTSEFHPFFHLVIIYAFRVSSGKTVTRLYMQASPHPTEIGSKHNTVKLLS